MSLAIFGFGVLVFLITVYGTVVIGGLLLTDRQLDKQPDLDPSEDHCDQVGVDRKRQLVPADY